MLRSFHVTIVSLLLTGSTSTITADPTRAGEQADEQHREARHQQAVLGEQRGVEEAADLDLFFDVSLPYCACIQTHAWNQCPAVARLYCTASSDFGFGA